MDTTQRRLADYAFDLRLDDLTPAAMHAAKARLIDTLCAIVTGFSYEPCRIARELAVRMPQPDGATVIGTRTRTSTDMAAFVNGTAASCRDGNEVTHPSDYGVAAILAAAEHARASGADLVVALALANTVYKQFAEDVGDPFDFSRTNLTCIASALAAGRLIGLTREQLAQAAALAAVTNVVLNELEDDKPSMWSAFAAGQAGRAALFAALTAQHGMAGPVRPFEGKTGWLDQVAGARLRLEPFGETVVATDPATELADRFRSSTRGILDEKQAEAVLENIWKLESLDNVAAIPAALVLA